MFSLPVENWWRLFIWLGLGFLIYFGYGRKHSVMRHYATTHPGGDPSPPTRPMPG
jgi:hypothetical protein